MYQVVAINTCDIIVVVGSDPKYDRLRRQMNCLKRMSWYIHVYGCMGMLCNYVVIFRMKAAENKNASGFFVSLSIFFKYLSHVHKQPV